MRTGTMNHAIGAPVSRPGAFLEISTNEPGLETGVPVHEKGHHAQWFFNMFPLRSFGCFKIKNSIEMRP
jgi:hypothetical protein